MQVIGDVIHYSGQAVARINPGIHGTLLDDFVEAINEYISERELPASEYEEIMERIKAMAKTKAQAGMISLEELDAIIKHVDEGTDPK